MKQLGRPVWLLVHKMRTLRFRKMSVSSDGIDVDERLVGATDWFLIVSTSPRTRRVLRFFFFCPQPASTPPAAAGTLGSLPRVSIVDARKSIALASSHPPRRCPYFPIFSIWPLPTKKKQLPSTRSSLIGHFTFCAEAAGSRENFRLSRFYFKRIGH